MALTWLLQGVEPAQGLLLQTLFSLSMLMSVVIVLVLPFQVFQSSLYSKGRFPRGKSWLSVDFCLALCCDFIGALTQFEFRN